MKFLKLRAKIIVIAALAIALVVGGSLLIANNNSSKQKPHKAVSKDGLQYGIDQLKKNQNTVEDKRALAASYMSAEQYDQSLKILLPLLRTRADPGDAAGALSICAYRDVAGREDCLSEAAKVLSDKAGSLDFRTAYSNAVNLEHAKKPQAAKVLYQRALDVYDPAKADEYTMTKDQLGAHINDIK